MDFFENRQRITIPGFSKQDAVANRQIVFPPVGVSAPEWHDRFVRRFEAALESNTWLPIYRASHGEFTFLTGRRDVPALGKGFLRYCVSRAYRVARFQSTFYSGGTPGFHETYKQWQLPRLRRDLARYIKIIGDEGVVCCYFSDRDTVPLSEQRQFSGWCAASGCKLDSSNYGHIYFVYGLFHGAKWKDYLKGRKLLLISSDQPTRTAALHEALIRLGVSDYQFIPISRSQSMLDRIQVAAGFKPDICIIGAGVGAANILWQVRGLKCPCVDAGFVLDTMAFPHLKKQRIYCVGDQEWDQTFGAEIPFWAEKFSDVNSIFPDVGDGRWEG